MQNYTQIDERTIIVNSTPQVPMFPDRPEPARVEPRKLTKAEVQKKFGWTDGDFDEALRWAFPIAMKRTGFASFVTLVWREDLLDRWAVEQRDEAERKLRLLKAFKK